jgi:hypothetical protein
MRTAKDFLLRLQPTALFKNNDRKAATLGRQTNSARCDLTEFLGIEFAVHRRNHDPARHDFVNHRGLASIVQTRARAIKRIPKDYQSNRIKSASRTNEL